MFNLPRRRKRTLLVLGIVLTLPVVILSMFFMNHFPGENLLLLVLTTPVWAVVGWEFHRGAIKTLRHGSANMDTLVALGSSTAFGYSLWALASGLAGHLYFMEAAAIITLISLGHWFEARASAQASDALRKLLRLAPERARPSSLSGETTSAGR